MHEPLRIGLLGCGMIGQIHADGLRMLAEDGLITPVAAADPSADARRAAANNCQFGYTTDDPSAVVGDPEVEAVVIATPTVSHRQLVMEALDAGKPLLCEKPLAPTFAQVQELCRAADASGLTTQVGFHSRFHPVMNRLHDAVTTGELGAPMAYCVRDDQYWPTGDVVSGHSSWRSSRREAGGGALLEHSIHAADLLCWMFGPPVRVYAGSRSVFGYDVEDVAALSVEHSSGVVGTLLTVFNAVRGREERRVEVFFERGAVEVTTDFIVGAEEDRFLLQRPDEGAQHLDLEALRRDRFATWGITRSDFLFYTYVSDRHWVERVRAGVPASPGFSDALVAHALVEAAYRSAAGNGPVDVDDVLSGEAP